MTPARMQKPMTLTIRVATRADVPAIVRMLSDDILGAKREAYADPLPPAYYDAFAEIEAMTGTEQIVAERDGVIIGSMQLTYIPGISKIGMKRAIIEAVRVDRSEEHTSELQSLMRISYAVFCLTKKNQTRILISTNV